MKEYKVHWASKSQKKIKINASSPQEAAKLFSESEPENLDEAVWVIGGFMQVSTFETWELNGEENKQKLETVSTSPSTSTDQTLEEIRSLLVRILWAIWGVGAMFAVTFIVPQFLK